MVHSFASIAIRYRKRGSLRCSMLYSKFEDPLKKNDFSQNSQFTDTGLSDFLFQRGTDSTVFYMYTENIWISHKEREENKNKKWGVFASEILSLLHGFMCMCSCSVVLFNFCTYQFNIFCHSDCKSPPVVKNLQINNYSTHIRMNFIDAFFLPLKRHTMHTHADRKRERGGGGDKNAHISFNAKENE